MGNGLRLWGLLFFYILVKVVHPIVPCGPEDKECITGQSVCRRNTCECINPIYSQGNGYFACYRQEEAYCQLLNDPRLRTYNKESVDFPYPCRYLLTHVRQDLRDKFDDVVGSCEFMIHAFNDKTDGKFFVKGYDINMRIIYDSGKVVESSTRQYGTAANNVYSYTVEGTASQYLPDGPYGNDDTNYNDNRNGISVDLFPDFLNNQRVFESSACGLRITFVAYDTVLKRDQKRVPGLSVSIDTAHKPRFLSNDMVMALAPVKYPEGLLFSDIQLAGLSIEDSVLVRAFSTMIPQTQPNENLQCTYGHETVRNCQSPQARRRALNTCSWILKYPRFIRCLDDTPNGEIILSVFNSCVAYFCNGLISCQTAIDAILLNGCGNVLRVQELLPFVNGNHCSP